MKPLVIALFVAAGFACSAGAMPVSTATNDPSNPSAPEAVASGRRVEVDAGPASYTCPMHPEVSSSNPGRCSKCGMNLVPKVR